MLKKFLLMLIVCSAFIFSANTPSDAWDKKKMVNLGEDKNKMTWFILDYGKKSNGVPFAVARKYYTNPEIRKSTINLLISKFKADQKRANELHFTQYEYAYTTDGKQFKQVYERHYDMSGKEIIVFTPRDKRHQGRKEFSPLEAVKDSIPYKAAKYALGE